MRIIFHLAYNIFFSFSDDETVSSETKCGTAKKKSSKSKPVKLLLWHAPTSFHFVFTWSKNKFSLYCSMPIYCVLINNTIFIYVISELVYAEQPAAGRGRPKRTKRAHERKRPLPK